ncbi:MAG: BMP family ABC transporter substrate-binding protein [Lachnospiraceae bacterium]|nr:BMP family ABC transporter substrate-binding protein [Lachnospiraceae bacterium]
MKSNRLAVLSALILISALTLSGCGKKNTAEIAMVTDLGTINDGSFNQGTYSGIEKYAAETGKSYNYYQPKKSTEEEYIAEIKKAVKNGAKIVVLPGEIFDEAVFDIQKEYPNVSFLLIDGVPHNEDYSDETIESNTRAVVFADEQAGFLAGYAAVREGYTSLGFLGGSPQDPVIRYGYGFVQGADYAAIELGVPININYCYGMTFVESEPMKELAKSWYSQGTQVIFACGGAMNRSVMKAAEEVNGLVIGVDVDQSKDSDSVITSAMKELDNASYQGVKDFYDGNFNGGSIVTMNASNDGIGLPMDTSRFKNFTSADYNAIYAQLVNGKLEPYAQTNFGNTFDLTLINTTVTYLELN